MHRMLGHVDRAAQRADGPLPVVLATEGRKADGIDLRMDGARLERFRANPVLGYGHNYWGRSDLPIGRVESVTIDGTTLRGDLVFDTEDSFAMEIERKMRAKFINAVSIGFAVNEWEGGKGDYWNGGVAVAWELSELSVVPIGMDPNALVGAGRGLQCPLCGGAPPARGGVIDRPELFIVGEGGAWKKYDPARHVWPDPPTPPAPEPPKPTEPAGFAVPESAARDLLAALKI